jgi:hypothetical protein
MFFALSVFVSVLSFFKRETWLVSWLFWKEGLITCHLKNVMGSCFFILQSGISWIDIFHGNGLIDAAVTLSHLLSPSHTTWYLLLVVRKGCRLRSTTDDHFAKTCRVDVTCVHYSSICNMGGGGRHLIIKCNALQSNDSSYSWRANDF